MDADLNYCWIQCVNKPRLSKYLCMRNAIMQCRYVNVGATRFGCISPSPLPSHPLHTCACQHSQVHKHTRSVRRAIRYRAADSSFGLLLSSYGDRPNKSEQRKFIHLSLPSSWGVQHSRQSQQGGAHVPTYCGTRPGKEANNSRDL